jgi:uncharacterized protein (TIGR02145 family)
VRNKVIFCLIILLVSSFVLYDLGNTNDVFAASELTPMYRLYNTKNGAYLYTRGDADRNHVTNTWPEFEFTDGVPAFYAPLVAQTGLTPIYRLYNTKNGMYLYTRGEADKNHVTGTWPEFEFTDGVPAFYASLMNNGDGTTPIFRLYNTKNGAYLYTRGTADRDHVLNTWPEFEYTDGVPAFYALVEAESEPLTVTIGTQTWMKKNLNLGQITTLNQDMSNNGIIEKWCYGNNPENCNTYGGLYQWDEMMQYSTTPGTQGICPTGFHLPTDAEWKTLERSLGMSINEVDLADWRGTIQGTLLMASGSFDFNALLSGWGILGFSDDDFPLFARMNEQGEYWTSTQYSQTDAWIRLLASDHTDVLRYNASKSKSNSVRCLKN